MCRQGSGEDDGERKKKASLPRVEERRGAETGKVFLVNFKPCR